MSTMQARFKVACPGCGFVRKVSAYVDEEGKPQDWCDPAKRYCGVCEMYGRSRHYAREAVRFRAKGNELLARRKAHQEKLKANAERKAKEGKEA